MRRESLEARRERARAIARRLARAYPRSTCALRHRDPFELLVATMLSAQTTDLAVNRVTPGLFARFPDARSMAQASEGAVEQAIAGIGLWRAKARNVREAARLLVERHGGEVPRDLDALVALPGVGRKTATAVLSTAFGMHAGITVDTHMLRVNRLLGLSDAREPEAMARALEALLPRRGWGAYTHRIIDHGRLVCVANRPRCGACPVSSLCHSAFDPAAGYRADNDGVVPASAKGLSWLAWETGPAGGR
ncbi:MAG TPA: endonuclease III [Candidatus Thermoplasmatota archaeon]|nr:endonuclease III [Candidatus Thermoplasmatota archaeon]